MVALEAVSEADKIFREGRQGNQTSPQLHLQILNVKAPDFSTGLQAHPTLRKNLSDTELF